jgi:hypothetical protein
VFGRRQLPELGVQQFQVHHGCRLRARLLSTKNAGGTFCQLGFPGRDLIRMHVILLRQISQRLLALDGGQCHLRLEDRAMRPSCSSCYGRS